VKVLSEHSHQPARRMIQCRSRGRRRTLDADSFEALCRGTLDQLGLVYQDRPYSVSIPARCLIVVLPLDRPGVPRPSGHRRHSSLSNPPISKRFRDDRTGRVLAPPTMTTNRRGLRRGRPLRRRLRVKHAAARGPSHRGNGSLPAARRRWLPTVRWLARCFVRPFRRHVRSRRRPARQVDLEARLWRRLRP